jgi:sugar-specific transcriptional regulator TrmB
MEKMTMTTIELLQQIGLNKYEAEAYYTLLAHGPLTGYELGKRSQVPLSRSYEILERLTQKGLALIQPGDPPHYSAGDPEHFLGQVRSTMATTLDALANALATLPRSDTSNEFWVLRGRQHILARTQTLIAEAQQAICLSVPASCDAEVVAALAHARMRGCQVFQPAATVSNAGLELILLLVDSHDALLGTLESTGHCQAIISANTALVTALSAYFAQQIPAKTLVSTTSSVATQQNNRLDWVAWEDRKQHRLWRLITGDRIA